MSRRDAFVAARQPDWKRLERLLGGSRLGDRQWSELARLYRKVCADLSRARGEELGEDVVAYLDAVAGRAHNALYGARRVGRPDVLQLLGREIPRAVRSAWRPVLVASLLFYGPMVLGFVAPQLDPSFASAVLPPEQLAQMEAMYAEPLSTRGGAGADAMMAGFYVFNNVGIAFRCFATGALFGLGSVFYLVYNGLVLGTVKGWLASVGLGHNLLLFVAGHAAWELTGIMLAGAAGLRMGWALVETDGLTRLASLRAAAPSLVRLVGGAGVMLLVAAAIEGFWSASPLPEPVKLAFGAIQVVIIAAWLLLGGRGDR